ncbi:MAG: dockerin type I repeat-containing protein, partial [Clostridia bacterium]|nr:dockerin type I repeat-containing protein [Clostridia bacterium]
FYGVFHAKVYHYSAYTMRRMYMQKIEIVDGKPQMTAAQSADTTYSIELNPLPLSARISGFDVLPTDGAVARPRLRRDIRLRPAFPQMDINGDGKLSLADVLRAMKFAVGGDFDEDDEIFADVNADGKNSLADVLLVLEKLL